MWHCPWLQQERGIVQYVIHQRLYELRNDLGTEIDSKSEFPEWNRTRPLPCKLSRNAQSSLQIGLDVRANYFRSLEFARKPSFESVADT